MMHQTARLAAGGERALRAAGIRSSLSALSLIWASWCCLFLVRAITYSQYEEPLVSAEVLWSAHAVITSFMFSHT